MREEGNVQFMNNSPRADALEKITGKRYTSRGGMNVPEKTRWRTSIKKNPFINHAARKEREARILNSDWTKVPHNYKQESEVWL